MEPSQETGQELGTTEARALLERALIAMQDEAGLTGQDIAALLVHYGCVIALANSGAEGWKELVDAVTTADVERWESGWRPDFLEP